jgi:hypothetical protein
LDYIIAFSRFALEKCRRHLQQKTGVHDTVAPSQSSELELLPYCHLTLAAPFRDDFVDEEELRSAAAVARFSTG